MTCLPSYLPVRLWQDAKKYGLGILTYTEDELIAGTKPDSYMALESRISHIPIAYHEDFGRFVNFPVNGCLFTGLPEDIEAIEPVLSHRYFHETQIFRSEPCFLEVVPKNVDKAYSLKHLLEILGIGREEMVCCETALMIFLCFVTPDWGWPWPMPESRSRMWPIILRKGTMTMTGWLR